jgi:hypothetical protein
MYLCLRGKRYKGEQPLKEQKRAWTFVLMFSR